MILLKKVLHREPKKKYNPLRLNYAKKRTRKRYEIIRIFSVNYLEGRKVYFRDTWIRIVRALLYSAVLLYAPMNVKPAGRAWGGDLIVFVVPGVGHLTDLALPGEGIFESFFAQRGDIWLPTRTKKTETEHMLPASTLHACAIRFEKIRKSWRPVRTSKGWLDSTVLSSNFVCFSVINWTS